MHMPFFPRSFHICLSWPALQPPTLPYTFLHLPAPSSHSGARDLLLDESLDSLDYVDFVEALHRRMPLRCGWMYANAIMPTAQEWERVFGQQVRKECV